MRMFKLDAECPSCGRVPAYRATEADVLAKRMMAAATAVGTIVCNRRGCDTMITLRAAAWHAAKPDGALPITGPVPAERATAGLSPRQAAVCSLVLQGLSDRRIADRLGVGLPAVRKHLTAGAERLRVADSRLPASSPRRTIAAWYSRRAGTAEVLAILVHAA